MSPAPPRIQVATAFGHLAHVIPCTGKRCLRDPTEVEVVDAPHAATLGASPGPAGVQGGFSPARTALRAVGDRVTKVRSNAVPSNGGTFRRATPSRGASEPGSSRRNHTSRKQAPPRAVSSS